jgi:hypothetical protein
LGDVARYLDSMGLDFKRHSRNSRLACLQHSNTADADEAEIIWAAAY